MSSWTKTPEVSVLFSTPPVNRKQSHLQKEKKEEEKTGFTLEFSQTPVMFNIDINIQIS